MTRAERIEVARKAFNQTNIMDDPCIAIVDALFPRKLKEVSVGVARVTVEDGVYRLDSPSGGRYSYLNVSTLAHSWPVGDDSTLKALLALHDNPWEE